jgi:hypothetical protein
MALSEVNTLRAPAFRSPMPQADCDTLLPEALICEPPLPGSRNCLTHDIHGSPHTVRPEELGDPRVNAEVFRVQQACRMRQLLPELASAQGPAAAAGGPPFVPASPAPAPRAPAAMAPPAGPQPAAELRPAIDPSAFRRLQIDRIVADVNTELAAVRPKLQLRLAQLHFTACSAVDTRQASSIAAWLKTADDLNARALTVSAKIDHFNRAGDDAEPVELLQLKSVIEGMLVRIRELDFGDNELDKAMRNVWPSYPGGTGANPIFRGLAASPPSTCQVLAPGEHALPPDIPRVARAPAQADVEAMRARHRIDAAKIAEWQADADVQLEDLLLNLDMLGDEFKAATGVDHPAALREIQARAQAVMASREDTIRELQANPQSVDLLRQLQSADQEALGLINVQLWLDQAAREAMKKWLDGLGQVAP